MKYPQFAVSKWIGHSITVSGRHYANAVPDELFDRAAGVEQCAAQKAAQYGAEWSRAEPQATETANPAQTNNPAGRGALRHNTSQHEAVRKWSRGESNPRAM